MRTVINAQITLTSPPFPLVEMGEAGGGRTPQDKERVKREIESTDRAIDRLVYELSHKGMKYGLREDEIRIVEGQ